MENVVDVIFNEIFLNQDQPKKSENKKSSKHPKLQRQFR